MMDKAIINMKSSFSNSQNLAVKAIYKVNNGLRLELSDTDCYGKSLNEGDKISFSRHFREQDITPLSSVVSVKRKIDDKTFIITEPRNVEGITIIPRNYDNTSGVTWPIKADFELSGDIGVYREDILSVLRNRHAGDVIFTFYNVVENESVEIANPKIVNGKSRTVLLLELSEEQYNIINQDNVSVSVSCSNYYIIDKSNKCRLWSEFEDESSVLLSINTAFYNIPIGIASNSDHVGLLKDDIRSEIYENEYRSGLIPDIVDYEKVRYTPVIYDDSGITDVEEIHLIFHFRTRNNDDGSWSIDSGNTIPWNNGISESDICKPVVESGAVVSGGNMLISDSIGLLGFVDDDVAYQKMKIKKTFVRISFYSSKVFSEQTLLCTSTIFLDSNDLREEYIKLFNDGKPNPIVDEISSEIYVTNCYNTERSSEGFYIYLFKQDAPKENEVKTIYMKVEFNHAKYGRTIPMINWPLKEDGTGDYLTPGNYHDCIYKKVSLSYINDRYVYWFDDISYINDDDISFVYFEPRLTVQQSRH